MSKNEDLREYINHNIIPVLHEIIQLDWDASEAVEVADKMYLDVEKMFNNLVSYLEENSPTKDRIM